MSAVLWSVIVIAVVVYTASLLGEQWRETDKAKERERRLAEIEDEQRILQGHRAALLAEEATLVTYDAVAARLPEHITRTIERTRP